MASLFRQRIAGKVISCIDSFLTGEEKFMFHGLLPRAVKLCKKESHSEPTTFEVHWKDLLDLKPDLKERVHPSSLPTVLKCQALPLGITSVEGSSEKSLRFSVDQNLFVSTLLSDLDKNINDLCSHSCFFTPVPPETVVVEFSSPNIAKPFHFGHFRSTVIGNFIANLCRFVGHKVITLNYVGDWGFQYGLLATGFSEFGSEDKLTEDPLLHLYEVYREANIKSVDNPHFTERAKNHFKKMEEGDGETLSQWQLFRDLSLQKMNETYQRLGIEFTEIHAESMYATETSKVFKELTEKSVASYERDGSLQAPILRNDANEKVVLQKSDGTSLYLSRDIAAALDRHNKYHFDTMYYVVDSSQSKHFLDLVYLIKALGYSWHQNIHHIPFGRISNFSTRKGNVVFLHDILNEAQERMLEGMKSSLTTKVHENMEETAEVLGISALIVGDLACRRRRDYEFDWAKILNVKGDSGVTLQYCNARLNNIKENCGVELKKDCDFSLLKEPQAIALIDILARFDEAVFRSYAELEPCLLVHYLFRLRNAVGSANKSLTVKGQPLNIARARLLLFHCAHLVLQTGLKILGIRPLSRM